MTDDDCLGMFSWFILIPALEHSSITSTSLMQIEALVTHYPLHKLDNITLWIDRKSVYLPTSTTPRGSEAQSIVKGSNQESL